MNARCAAFPRHQKNGLPLGVLFPVSMAETGSAFIDQKALCLRAAYFQRYVGSTPRSTKPPRPDAGNPLQGKTNDDLH